MLAPHWKGKDVIKRWLLIGTVAASLLFAAGLTTAPAAYAYDGECSGSFAGFEAWAVIPCTSEGFFYDPNRDASKTALHLKGCDGNPDIGLYRRIGLTWFHQGTHRFYCWNTDGGWKEWGDMPAGYYQFGIVDPRSPDGRLDVAYYHIGY